MLTLMMLTVSQYLWDIKQVLQIGLWRYSLEQWLSTLAAYYNLWENPPKRSRSDASPYQLIRNSKKGAFKISFLCSQGHFNNLTSYSVKSDI